jgi:hypothetical protein
LKEHRSCRLLRRANSQAGNGLPDGIGGPVSVRLGSREITPCPADTRACRGSIPGLLSSPRDGAA